MTNEIENPENLPVEAKPHIPIEGGQLMPQDAAGLYHLATIMSKTPMVPDAYRKDPASTFVAIQMGMEVGLRPMQALQNIAVIKGKPTIYADGITGLLHGSKQCEYIKEWFEVDGKEVDPSDLPLGLDEWPQNLKAVSEIKRVGSAQQVYRGTFSVSDAIRMGKWNKPNKSSKSIWQRYPARMLMWRARTYAARDGFSDVLKGLGIFEEVQDYDADMEDANGHYEVVEKPKLKKVPEENVAEEDAPTKSIFDEMCEAHNIDPEMALNYCKEIHEITGAPILTITIKATQNPDEFRVKYNQWLKVQPEAEKKMDPFENPANTTIHGPDDIFQDPPGPKIDEDGFSADMDANKKAETQARTEDSVGDSIDPPADKVDQSSEDEGGADNVRPGADQDSTPGDAPAPATSPPKSTIKKWIGMQGKVFRKYVNEHPEDFEGISVEEYNTGREKWNKLVYARFKESWPLEDDFTQKEISFPEQTNKQMVNQMKKDHPEMVEKSMKFRGFAKGGLGDQAEGIVVEDVLELIGGRVLKK